MPSLASSGTGPLPSIALASLVLLLVPSQVADSPLVSTTARARTTSSSAATTATLDRRDDGSESPDDERTVSGADVCVDAGYLCAGVAAYGSYRVIRYPSTTEELRIRVPRPGHESDERALRLQEAAIRGIEAWDGRPFPIRFVDEEDVEAADIVLRWEAQLSDGGLGETQSRFKREDGVAHYRVADLALATRNPYHADAPLAPEEVELTAAHEMGHALGLPHSDNRGDLMYPTDAANRLSDRDFRTLRALYRIPNGTRIVK